MRAAIRSMLLASPEVAALVGPRVYPRRVPQGAAYPAITYEVRPDYGVNHGGRERLDHVSLSVDCWAREASGAPASTTAAALADAVVDAMAGQRAKHGAWELSWGSAQSYEDGLDEETGLYSVAVELSGWARSP